MKLVVDADSDRAPAATWSVQAGEIIQGRPLPSRQGATKQIFDQNLGIHPTAAVEFVTLRTPVEARAAMDRLLTWPTCSAWRYFAITGALTAGRKSTGSVRRCR